MELNISERNPILIISDELPRLVTVWSPESEVAKDTPHRYPSVNPRIYREFRERFDVIEIMATQNEAHHFPKVFISALRGHIVPDLSKLSEERLVPNYFIGKNLAYDPGNMKGVYQYRRRGESRFTDLAEGEYVEEEFFFPYTDGFEPLRFCEVANAIRPLYQLTSIIYRLTFFKLILLKNGVFVSIQAKTEEHKKLPLLF